MIEEDEPILAAEYIATIEVALALSNMAPGCIRIEHLIRSAFCNTIMRNQYIQNSVPSELHQGRIDVAVVANTNALIPRCLVEIKRDANLSLIKKDAERIAVLIECTKPNLQDLFGFCLFPLRFSPLATNPPDYEAPRAAELEKVKPVLACLRKAHPSLIIDVQNLQEFSINRASIDVQEHADGRTEEVWDRNGFQMEPAAITVERRSTQP